MMSRLVRKRLSFTWKVALPRFYTTMKARSIKLAAGDDSSFNTLYLPAHSNSMQRPLSSILTVFLYPFPVTLLCVKSCCLEGACSSGPVLLFLSLKCHNKHHKDDKQVTLSKRRCSPGGLNMDSRLSIHEHHEASAWELWSLPSSVNERSIDASSGHQIDCTSVHIPVQRK